MRPAVPAAGRRCGGGSREVVPLYPSKPPRPARRAARRPCASPSRASTWSRMCIGPASLSIYPRRDASGTAVIVVPAAATANCGWTTRGTMSRVSSTSRVSRPSCCKYRLPRAPGSRYTIEGDALGDLMRAVRLVRSRAGEWSLDPHEWASWDSPPAGNLPALGAMRFRCRRLPTAAEASRPHELAAGFRRAGLSRHLSKSCGSEAETPPMFLLCGSDDRPEVVAGLTRIYLALREQKVPAELHLYDRVRTASDCVPAIPAPSLPGRGNSSTGWPWRRCFRRSSRLQADARDWPVTNASASWISARQARAAASGLPFLMAR